VIVGQGKKAWTKGDSQVQEFVATPTPTESPPCLFFYLRRAPRGHAVWSCGPGVLARPDTTAFSRAQVIALASRGRSAEQIAEILHCSRSHVYRTVERFQALGRAGLLDGRRDNGTRLVTTEVETLVASLLGQSPRDHGYLRPTWTRELFVRVVASKLGLEISVTTMSRLLHRLRARHGRPKPIVCSTLSDRQKRRRLAKLKDLVASCPDDQAVVYEDEVDIHLNPKIGPDWMAHGHQKQVVTPGKNAKAYVAGCLDAHDGTLVWVGGTSKTGALFVEMLRKLDACEHYADCTLIHLIVDNYSIHSSLAVVAALKDMPRLKLHFLPPYCPDYNRIERVWQDLHANVTRNHQHKTLPPLCREVGRWLDAASPRVAGQAMEPVRLTKVAA
jgi:transposase